MLEEMEEREGERERERERLPSLQKVRTQMPAV
jgi:hypothetical protein